MSRNNDTTEQSHTGYSYYALVCLMVVYVFNFLDRQIVSILAENIKADLGINDAQMGFIYGTAFALFYAVFGIPLARLADVWSRKRLIAIGMSFWSLMTAASGFARDMTGLAACRFGVGIGEASATPSASSMLADYFPPRLRATAIAIYSSGSYIGAGLGVFLGGLVVTQWQTLYPDPASAPFGFAGWQAAFVAAGLPGIAIALWVATLREPKRGAFDGQQAGQTKPALQTLWSDLVTIIPPLTLYGLKQAGGNARDFAINAGAAAVLAGFAWLASTLMGNAAQWIAVAIGLYAATSWAQSLAHRDPDAFEAIFRSRTVLLIISGFSLAALASYGTGFWVPSYFIRQHGISEGDIGAAYGLCVIVGGFVGVSLGGFIADLAYRKFRSGRLVVGLVSILLTIPLTILTIEARTASLAYIFLFGYCLVSPLWLGICFSSLVDLVRPNLRATVVAVSILTNTLVGLSIGPSFIGLVSDTLTQDGAQSGAALGRAIEWSVAFLILSAILINWAIRTFNNGRPGGRREPIASACPPSPETHHWPATGRTRGVPYKRSRT